MDLYYKSQEIQAEYSHYFDWVIVNDDLQVATDMLIEVARRIEEEPQWVPANWAEDVWTVSTWSLHLSYLHDASLVIKGHLRQILVFIPLYHIYIYYPALQWVHAFSFVAKTCSFVSLESFAKLLLSTTVLLNFLHNFIAFFQILLLAQKPFLSF